MARHFEVEDVGDVTVVRFMDRKILDEPTMQAVREPLFQLVDQLGRRKVLIDFRHVEYLSSAFLGTLITLNKKIHEAGGQLALSNLDPQLQEVFQLTRLDKLLKIRRPTDEDDPEAMGGVRSPLQPPGPSGIRSAALQPPPPDPDDES
jgi:anti-sigma B factor antagonist